MSEKQKRKLGSWILRWAVRCAAIVALLVVYVAVAPFADMAIAHRCGPGRLYRCSWLIFGPANSILPANQGGLLSEIRRTWKDERYAAGVIDASGRPRVGYRPPR